MGTRTSEAPGASPLPPAASAARGEIYGGAQANSQGKAPNLDAPVIETLETEEDQTRPV